MVKLFVSGFPLDISEMEIAQLFSVYGDVATIKIVRNKKTGTCKGYAFLEMKNKEGADRAIDALDYAPVSDRMFTVRLVEDDPEPGYAKKEMPSTIIKKKRLGRPG